MDRERDRYPLIDKTTVTSDMNTNSQSDLDDDSKIVEEDPQDDVKTATNYFKDYVASKGHSLHSISQMPPIQIAEYLKDFYALPLYCSVKYVRTGLQRYFQKNLGIDIVQDKDFMHANNVFDVAVKQAPNRRCHRLRIEYEDLKKIYLGAGLDTNQPDTLQNKVFFDVNLYICNRGKDFLRVMSKSDFEVGSDVDGRRYVWLKNSSKFSFKELVGGLGEVDSLAPGTQIGDRMYERQGDPRCPVASFTKYLSHLHPMTDAFWQRPKRNFVAADYVWYDNTPLGNSTISKIMTRTCQCAGLFENYTNHAIKSSYIPIIENICSEAVKKANLQNTKGRNSPYLPRQSPLVIDEGRKLDSFGTTSSLSSDLSRDTETDIDDDKIGIQGAKMKVLDMVHKLEVKDIRAFVDWLKSFRVECDGGGLMVMCSPVDQTVAATKEEPLKRAESSVIMNGGDKRREFSPGPAPPPMRSRSSPALQVPKSLLSFEREPSKLATEDNSDKASDGKSDDLSIAIKQVEFEDFGDTHCSSSELSPLKVTVPTQNTILMTGVPDSMQLLIHNRESPPMSAETLQSRVYYSQHEMDVAVVTAMLSARNSIKSNPDSKKEHLSTLQDKHKPMKKRSLTDLLTSPREEPEGHPPPKRYFSSGYIEYNPKLSEQLADHKPTSIYHVPVTSRPSKYDQTLTSFNVIPNSSVGVSTVGLGTVGVTTVPVIGNLNMVNPSVLSVKMMPVQPVTKIAIKSEPVDAE
ncbi:hypothetical protein FSP39_001973 [Pinctada imbricata]|uniref:DUF3504 domain-containing protein n=1 Tax=Pinctada imbricata TaxID=66713 RepID=A0AA88Y2Y5_PINIB|nr:hypothetical protein FSP39_001973 [Pinctada imbricata]